MRVRAAQTAAQMAKTLHIVGGAETLHLQAEQFVRTANSAGPEYTLQLANRLFGAKRFDFVESFIALTRDRYLAALELLDFAGNPEASRRQINTWVEERTRHRIKNLLPPTSVSKDSRLVLVNALYFKGPWEQPFSEHATKPAPFHVDPRKSPLVTTMHATGYYHYAERDDVRLLRLPYRGNDLLMTVVLPRKRLDLPAVERGIDGETLKRWLGATYDMKWVSLALPRFTIRPAESVDLKRTLIALGMRRPFERFEADFSGIADPPAPEDRLYIGNVFHQAFVEVAEKGTEAAAATAVGMKRAGGMPGEPIAFNVDHPFLFVIHSRDPAAVLFIGRVVDPR
jgi:serpin B